jgi:hypothetical protein
MIGLEVWSKKYGWGKIVGESDHFFIVEYDNAKYHGFEEYSKGE